MKNHTKLIIYTKFIVFLLIITVPVSARDGLNGVKGISVSEQSNHTEIQKITDELNIARLNNNIQKKDELTERLRSLYGETKTGEINDVSVIPGVMNNDKNPPVPPMLLAPDLYFVDGTDIRSTATQTTAFSNTIYAATTKFYNSVYDIISVFASYDEGKTWICKGYSYLSARFNNGELDIEPLISGTDTVIFCASGYTVGRHSFSGFFSFNISTGAQSFSAWYHWGSASPGVNVYNPKITSDNSIYAGAFVYIAVAVDSIRSNGSKNVFQRFGMVFNPFASSIAITYRNIPSFYWWGTAINNENYYLWHDICYYRTPAMKDRIYSVYNIAAYNSIYAAYSDNYGVSAAGNSIYTDGLQIDQVQIASCGGHFNYNTAIAYRVRTNSANNYDYKCLYSSNGETSINSFTNSYVEGNSSDAVRFTDMQAVKLSKGKYKFVYVNSNGPGSIYYKGNINSSSYEPVSALQIDSLWGIGSYGKMRAGYISGQTPGCMIIYYSAFSNSTLCAVNFCNELNKTSHEPVSDKFSIENYPNPFNPVTRIKFNIPDDGAVKITVYDILGKEIQVLVDGVLKSGRHEVSFDGSLLSSGTYFYSVEANGYKDIKKMVLIK